MNPEIALPEEVVELCSTAIDAFVDVLRRQKAAEEITPEERYCALGAAVIACNTLGGDGVRNGWHKILRQECAARGYKIRPLTRYQKHLALDSAYSSVPTSRSFENTVPNAIAALLEFTAEENS